MTESKNVDSGENMSHAKYIKIEQLKVLKNRLLTKLSYSKNVEKYFVSNLFYVEYDQHVYNVSKSILYIPAVSSLITVAWAIGADIYVEELDKTYLESLGKIELVMKDWYPNLPFSTNIHVEKVVPNSFSNNGYGLLFSGGIDSTASYIRHKSKKPDLIMVLGLDIPLDEEKFWRKVKNEYEDFAHRENVKINFIKTNARQFIDERLLGIEFGRYLTSSWWGGFQHGIFLLGLCAPLTVEHIGTILIAATYTRQFKYPWGSHPLIDNKISWADVGVVHDAYELSRQEKIRYVLKNYVRNSGHHPFLWVCWSSLRDFNCGKCEKCSRTIIGLVLENIDPNKCGFNINSKFFDFLKQNLIDSRFIWGEDEDFMWKDIQRHIPEVMGHNLHDSKKFFEWFKTFDVSGNMRKRNIIRNTIKSRLRYFYYKLPSNIQNKINRFLNL